MTWDNTNRGALFKETKEGSNRDYSGSLNVNGNDYWLSGWGKEADGARKYSLSAQPKNGDGESGTGELSPNSRKTADNHPDVKGHIVIGAETVQLAGWKRESKAGNRYLSISVDAKTPEPVASSAPDDDVPF